MSKILFLLKLAITSVSVFWLFYLGGIDFKEVRIGLSNRNLFVIFFLITVIQMIFGSFRLAALLKLKKVYESIDLFIISWRSSFINCIAPTTLFAEVFRISELKKIKNIGIETSIYTSIFSKFFSTLSLLMISFLVIAFKFSPDDLFFWISLFGLFIFFLGYFLWPYFIGCLSSLANILDSSILKKRIDFLNCYALDILNFKTSVKIFLLSLLIQVFNVCSVVVITLSLNSEWKGHFYELFFIIPYGLFIKELPISFYGFGVGHIAFLNILKKYGIENGAEVFTIYLAFSYFLNLIGGMFFLKDFKDKFFKICRFGAG